ncbi:MAG: hypothetical protein AAFV19_07345 [Pseudomonadota bacterium]
MDSRIRYTTAQQVAEAFPEAAEDIGEIPEGLTPLDFVSTLAEDEDLARAVIFTALALPKREAVWWGCLCIRGIGDVSDVTKEGLRLAEAWVRHPEEAERRAAGKFAEEEYFEGAGAGIAFAAFTTSGSLAPAGLQAVPPSPEISGKCVAMAILQAANDEDAFVRHATLLCALESARDFATGGDGTAPWRERGGGAQPAEPAEAG